MVYIIHYFLGLHFGEDFMKIRTKILKLQMYENLQKKCEWKHVFIHIFMQFFISHMVFNPFKMAVQFF